MVAFCCNRYLNVGGSPLKHNGLFQIIMNIEPFPPIEDK